MLPRFFAYRRMMWGIRRYFFEISELNVNRLSVEHSVNLLVCPAEHLLIEVPEINYEQNADYHTAQLNGLFAEIAH